MKAFTVANDRNLIELIQQAQRRLVFMAPAVSQPVAEALIERLNELKPEAVAITLDVDAETYRLGYGDPGTLDLLYAATRQRGCPFNRQVGLRIGVVISDDLMMVYAPTPLLIESGPNQEHRPNAVMVGPPSPTVLCEVGFGEHGYKEQTIGRDLVKETEITPVQEDLRVNPPQRFDLAQVVRVFNSHIEFVEFKLVGTAIDRKTVPIPSWLIGLAGDERTENLLKASFQVVDHTDTLSGKDLEHDKNLIVRSFLKPLTGYGNAILRTQKDEFEKAVKKLRDNVKIFRKKLESDLQKAMDKNRELLRQALAPSLLKNPPKEWRKSDGSAPDNNTLNQWLDDELRRAFGTAEKLIGKMEVRLLYKAVTYESLTDSQFIEVAKKAFPSLNNLLDESSAVAATAE